MSPNSTAGPQRRRRLQAAHPGSGPESQAPPPPPGPGPFAFTGAGVAKAEPIHTLGRSSGWDQQRPPRPPPPTSPLHLSAAGLERGTGWNGNRWVTASAPGASASGTARAGGAWHPASSRAQRSRWTRRFRGTQRTLAAPNPAAGLTSLLPRPGEPPRSSPRHPHPDLRAAPSPAPPVQPGGSPKEGVRPRPFPPPPPWGKKQRFRSLIPPERKGPRGGGLCPRTCLAGPFSAVAAHMSESLPLGPRVSQTRPARGCPAATANCACACGPAREAAAEGGPRAPAPRAQRPDPRGLRGLGSRVRRGGILRDLAPQPFPPAQRLPFLQTVGFCLLVRILGSRSPCTSGS